MGGTPATARTLAIIMILSIISSLAIADDAGSGSDAVEPQPALHP